MEKLLNYPRNAVGVYDGVPQRRSWDCCPASVQVIAAACGIYKDEQFLIDKIGTTTAGTNHAGLACPILNELLPGSGYTAVWLPKEPVSKSQVETLWNNIVSSVDAGRGVLLNFEAPPNNFPKGANGSVSPNYTGWNTIYHYVAGMGYAVDDAGKRYVWIADPGFSPFGYWISLEQCATLIVPHAYAWASTAKPLPTQSPSTQAPVTVQLPTDALRQLWLEWNATQYGDQAAIGEIVKAAAGGDVHAKAALALLERANPSALQAFISKG